MPEAGQPTLVRAIGRWSLAALTINCIIGSGIFGLPSQLSATLGKASPFAWIFAAIATALVMACFAEVSSRFDQTGGVYLYSRAAFGRSTGIAVAWLGWLARLTAAAANASGGMSPTTIVAPNSRRNAASSSTRLANWP